MHCAVVSFDENDNKKNGLIRTLTGGWLFTKKITVSAFCLPDLTSPIHIFSLPYTTKSFIESDETAIKKITAKCLSLMLAHGVECVYLPRVFCEKMGCEVFESHFILPTGRLIFNHLIGHIFKLVAKKHFPKTTDIEVGIWQSELGFRSKFVLDRICEYSRYITLFANSTSNSANIIEDIYTNTGLSVGICSDAKKLAGCDIVILLDEHNDKLLADKTTVIDLSGTCNNAYHSILFNVPFGMSTLTDCVDKFDERFVEFLLYAYNQDFVGKNTPEEYLANIGCKIKHIIKLLLQNKKILDNMR